MRIVRLSIGAVLLCILAEVLFFTVISMMLSSKTSQVNPVIPNWDSSVDNFMHITNKQSLTGHKRRNVSVFLAETTSQITKFDSANLQLHTEPAVRTVESKSTSTSNDNVPVFAHHKLLPSRDNLTYIRALKEWASPDDVIVLAFVDDGVLDMAFNLIGTSLMKHSIHNVLFVSSSVSTCQSLEHYGYPCLLFRPMNSSSRYSKFDSKDFVEKMKRRSYFIIDTLSQGFSVLLTDVDVVYLKNPFEYLNTLIDFDIAPLEDKAGTTLNAGFLYIKPTKSAIELYERMNHLASHNPTLGEQVRFNLAIKKMRSDFTNSSIRVSILPSDRFQSGRTYWELGQRSFFTDNPCMECVVIHDNFVIGHEAKIWRLKEMQLWMFDANKYYSCTDCKYLHYYNPTWFGASHETTAKEIGALKTALLLGVLLKRIVIMPKFHGNDEHHFVSLQNVVKIDPIHAQLRNIIRENSFLSHPKVPSSVKSGPKRDLQYEAMVHDTKNSTRIKVLPEYVKKLQGFKDTILHFPSLYDVEVHKLLLKEITNDILESIDSNIVPYINV